MRSAQQILNSYRRFRGAQRGHSLMFVRAGEPIETCALLETNRHSMPLGELDDRVDAFAVAAARDYDPVEAASRVESFFHSVESGDPIHHEVLVQGGAEFQHALASIFHFRREGKLRRGIEQQDHTIQLTFTRAPRKR